jgi:hypothetical protein
MTRRPPRRDHNSNQPNVWQEDHTGSPDVDDFVWAGQTDGRTRAVLMSTAWSERVDPMTATNFPRETARAKRINPMRAAWLLPMLAINNLPGKIDARTVRRPWRTAMRKSSSVISSSGCCCKQQKLNRSAVLACVRSLRDAVSVRSLR